MVVWHILKWFLLNTILICVKLACWWVKFVRVNAFTLWHNNRIFHAWTQKLSVFLVVPKKRNSTSGIQWNIVFVAVESPPKKWNLNFFYEKLQLFFTKSGVTESVKRSLSTPKVSGSNPREAQWFSSLRITLADKARTKRCEWRSWPLRNVTQKEFLLFIHSEKSTNIFHFLNVITLEYFVKKNYCAKNQMVPHSTTTKKIIFH